MTVQRERHDALGDAQAPGGEAIAAAAIIGDGEYPSANPWYSLSQTLSTPGTCSSTQASCSNDLA